MQLLFEDCNQHVGAYGRPVWGVHGVLSGAEKGLDLQVLLYALEKKFDLPVAFLDVGNRSRRHHGIVRKNMSALPQFMGSLKDWSQSRKIAKS